MEKMSMKNFHFDKKFGYSGYSSQAVSIEISTFLKSVTSVTTFFNNLYRRNSNGKFWKLIHSSRIGVFKNVVTLVTQPINVETSTKKRNQPIGYSWLHLNYGN